MTSPITNLWHLLLRLVASDFVVLLLSIVLHGPEGVSAGIMVYAFSLGWSLA